ncbi:ribonuclease P/MRP protein subunit POP5 [Periplaneta americana]|uniref:ribonuclease P/MRP protein subunit POP5 n=1 Tax=Periplaneta americana TaxID=6978 RepID=UPI0037E7234B
MVRFKNRYIVVEVNQPDRKDDAALVLKPVSLYVSILNKVQQTYGDFGVAAIRSGLSAKYCNKWTRIAVVRVRHGVHRFVTSCLPLLQMIDNKTVVVRTLYTGATLKQCYRFIKDHQKSCLEKMWSSLKTDDERKMMEDALMDLSALETFVGMKKPESSTAV